MASEKNLYNAIVDVTADYLGPAARRFIDRQIQNHLEKAPDELTVQDLSSLIDWIRVSFAFLTEDRNLIEELSARLRKLESKG